MITEDYYGFSDLKFNQQLKLKHNSRIKSKHSLFSGNVKKGAVIRSLKRTELSNEKLSSRQKKDAKKVVSPRQVNLNQNRQLQSGLKVVPSQNELSESNRQEIQMMLKKYGSYKNADSYWFRGNETSRDNKSNCLADQQGRNRFRREIKKSQGEDAREYNELRKGRVDSKLQRNYYSCSGDKRQDYLLRFQREAANEDSAFDRFRVRRIGSGLVRKSRSLAVLPTIRQEMHTYYNAEKRRYYDYDDNGYVTQKQQLLINRIRKASLQAFQRAFPQHKAKKQLKRSKNFQVEEASKLQHRNSGILGNLREEYEEATNNASLKILDNSLDKQLGERKYEESADILIDSRKSSRLADEYQIGCSSLRKLSQQQQGQILVERKHVLNDLHKVQTLREDSLLQFKPRRGHEENKLSEETVARSAVTGDTQINRIQINDSCKPEVTTKVQINTVNSGTLRNKISSQNDRNSYTSQSNSRSSSQQISSSHYSDLGSKTISLQSKRVSNTSSQKESSNQLNFSKKKTKKQNESMSQGLEESSPRDLKDTAQFNPIFKNFQPDSFEHELLVQSYKFHPESQMRSIISSKEEGERVKFRVQSGSQKQTINGESQKAMQSGMAIKSPYNNLKLFSVPLGPINQKGSRFQNEVESSNEESLNQMTFKPRKHESLFNSKDKAANSVLQHKQQSNCLQQQPATQKWELFEQLQLLLQFQNSKSLLAQNMKNLRSAELGEVLKKIEVYLKVMEWMQGLVSSVGDVYELQSVYHPDNQWLLLSIFLTLKKCFYEKGRMIVALSGGKNCFKSLNCIIEDSILKKYIDSVQIIRILNHLKQCNWRLEQLIKSFHQKLVEMDSSYVDHPTINLTALVSNEQLYILLSYFDQQVDILLLMREEQLRRLQVAVIGEEELLVVARIDERIFRLMQMGFIMSSLSGRHIKAVEYEERPYSEEKCFRNYLFENHQQFKEVIKYFR